MYIFVMPLQVSCSFETLSASFKREHAGVVALLRVSSILLACYTKNSIRFTWKRQGTLSGVFPWSLSILEEAQGKALYPVLPQGCTASKTHYLVTNQAKMVCIEDEAGVILRIW